MDDLPHQRQQCTVKLSDQGKRWYNYAPTEFLISFYGQPNPFLRPLGYGTRNIDIARTHIVLDHINEVVCFYSDTQ